MCRTESRSHSSAPRSSLAALALAALAAAGCGHSSDVTGAPEAVASGRAVLQATVQGVGLAGSTVGAATRQSSSSGSGYTVTVVGAKGVTVEIDEDGRFVIGGLPAGAVTLRIEGSGVSAQVTIQGLVDGQVLTVVLQLAGGTVQVSGAPTCSPSAETEFSGQLEQTSSTRLVVSGHTVDVTQLQKVWKPTGRAQLSDLEVGDRVKVWGTLRGDGVVVADEIMSLTTDSGDTWFSFKGKVEGVSGASATHVLDDVHGDPNVSGSPTLVIAGKTVYTSGSTGFRWSDGSTLDPRDIKVGQTAYVEGYRNADGALKATAVVVEGTGSAGAFVSFRGKVANVVALSARDVSASCYLKLTVGGRRVETDGGTAFKWSDGSALDPYAVKDGQTASVEGYTQSDGYVLATKFVVDK